MNKVEKQKTSKRWLIPILLVLGLMLIIFWSLPVCRPPRELSPRVLCGTNMTGLVKAILVYARLDEFGRPPTAEKWCDLLIQNDYVTYRQFVCRGSDAILGECSYAMNEHLAGKDISKLPPDVVVLFETNFGRHAMGRQGLLKDRECYKFMPNGKRETMVYELRNPETKVYKLRWNQVCGPELLTVENHDGEGCNIVYASSRVEFVETKDLGKLKWEPDEEK